MKTRQHRVSFRRNQRPRHMPHGRNCRRKNPKTLPIERSTRKVESFASGSHTDHWRKITDGHSHDPSVSAIGRPSSIATFFERRSRFRPCAADRSAVRCRAAVSDSPQSADWPLISVLASAEPTHAGFQSSVPCATWSDAKNIVHDAEAQRQSRRTLWPPPLRPEPAACTRPCTFVALHEPKPLDPGGALRARPLGDHPMPYLSPPVVTPGEQCRSSLPC